MLKEFGKRQEICAAFCGDGTSVLPASYTYYAMLCMYACGKHQPVAHELLHSGRLYLGESLILVSSDIMPHIRNRFENTLLRQFQRLLVVHSDELRNWDGGGEKRSCVYIKMALNFFLDRLSQ